MKEAHSLSQYPLIWQVLKWCGLEIDLSSGLWPYAHNASSDKGDGNGFWNDMDILEVGVSNRPEFTPQNDSDLAALAAARAHLTMCAPQPFA